MPIRTQKLSVNDRHSAPNFYARSLPHDRQVRDEEVPHLARRIRGSHKTWIVQIRQSGRVKKVTLGTCQSIPVVRARAMALDLLKAEPVAVPLSGETRVSVFADIFLEDCTGRWKPATLRGHSYCLRNLILPHFGKLKLGEITRGDVTVWFQKVKGTDGSRNRALSVLSSLFVHAEIRGLRS
ncbi:MAG: hypothetical protein AAGF15_02240, partial [Pseudomonadota bacterium]